MLTRLKSSSEAKQTIFITFAKQVTVVKRLLVKIWLFKAAVKSVHRILRTTGQNFRGNNYRWRLERISSERHQESA